MREASEGSAISVINPPSHVFKTLMQANQLQLRYIICTVYTFFSLMRQGVRSEGSKRDTNQASIVLRLTIR